MADRDACAQVGTSDGKLVLRHDITLDDSTNIKKLASADGSIWGKNKETQFVICSVLFRDSHAGCFATVMLVMLVCNVLATALVLWACSVKVMRPDSLAFV